MLKTGLRWRDFPVEMGCGAGVTCWRHLRDWQEAGAWTDCTVFADRSYDCEPHRQVLRERGIEPVVAKRRTEHGSGLGK